MNGCSLRLPPSFLRPLLQNARPLPHGEPDPRPVFDCRDGYLTGLVRIVAGVEQALESARLGPLFDLVVVAMVGCGGRSEQSQRLLSVRWTGTPDGSPSS
jgi:hypothetical protein